MSLLRSLNRIRRMNAHLNEKNKMARYGVNYKQVVEVLDELNEFSRKHWFKRIPDRIDYIVWKRCHPGRTILNTPLEDIHQWVETYLQ